MRSGSPEGEALRLPFRTRFAIQLSETDAKTPSCRSRCFDSLRAREAGVYSGTPPSQYIYEETSALSGPSGQAAAPPIHGANARLCRSFSGAQGLRQPPPALPFDRSPSAPGGVSIGLHSQRSTGAKQSSCFLGMIGEDDVGPRATHRRQRLQHDAVVVDPPLLGSGLEHRVFARDVVRRNR